MVMHMAKVYYHLIIVLTFSIAACGSPELEGNDSSMDNAVSSAMLSSAESSLLVPQPNSLAPQLLRAADHGSGFGWKQDKCFLCHTMTELKTAHDYNSILASSLSNIGEDDIGACLYCHGSNGINDVTAGSYRCMFCHTDDAIVDSAGMFSGCNTHDMNADGWIDNADCVICHAFSDMNGEIDVAVDLRKGATDYANVSEFCLNCHDGNGAFGIVPPELSTGNEGSNIYSTYKGMGENASVQKQTADIHGARNGPRSGYGAGSGSGSESGSGEQGFAEFRGAYKGGMAVACLDCHQVHSSDNPYLITQNGACAQLADEEARTAVVVVTENNFTQLCAVCHTSSGGAPTDNGLTQVVHPGTYSAFCTDCHYHGAGFGADKSGLF